MLTSLGFDTLIIHLDKFHSDIGQTFDFFYDLGIKNFLFIFDYDPLCDSISLKKSKMNKFKELYAKSASRKIKIKCAFNLHISEGASFNSSLSSIYCNKQARTVFLTLPLFTDCNYQPIALDINNLLYKIKAYPIFTSFEKTIESSNLNFCSKFINNSQIGISIDLNYLLNPQKENVFKELLKSNTAIFPSITQNLSNYAGIYASTEFIIKNYGKKDYYALCSQINKGSLKLSF